jgi:hypothetical protein
VEEAQPKNHLAPGYTYLSAHMEKLWITYWIGEVALWRQNSASIRIGAVKPSFIDCSEHNASLFGLQLRILESVSLLATYWPASPWEPH